MRRIIVVVLILNTCFLQAQDVSKFHRSLIDIENSIEEHIEHEEGKEASYSDEVDVASPDNYGLTVDLTIYDGKLYFTPNFHNKTGLELSFKQKSKLSVALRDENENIHQQYLYDVILSTEKEQMLDDSAIRFDGKNHFLNTSVGLIPFFPPDLKNGDYIFRLKLENPLFGEVYSSEQKITLPLALEKDPNIIHLNGAINTTVRGDLYVAIDDSQVRGSFINTKTGQRIKLTGELKGKILNLKEYEKEDKLSGYFEGEYKKGVYKGNWLSPSKKTRVPFEFKQQ